MAGFAGLKKGRNLILYDIRLKGHSGLKGLNGPNEPNEPNEPN
jgi:hypothetical protein